MSTLVAIPWRPNGDVYRARNFNYVHGLFTQRGFTVEAIDSPGDPFNRAAVRNACAQAVLDGGYDVVVICDADCVLPLGGLNEAVSKARTYGGLHYPFRDCLYLSDAETDAYLADPDTFETARFGGYASGGCFVINPADWFKSGGMDERLATWGGEDDAFYVSQNTLVTAPRYHSGTMYHLAHGRDSIAFGSAEHQANIQLLARYSGAHHNPELMKSITNEWRT